MSLTVGTPANLTATVSNVTGGTVSEVKFTPSGVATANPLTDSSSAYQTTVGALSQGNGNIKADVYFQGNSSPVFSKDCPVTASWPPLTSLVEPQSRSFQ